MKRNVFILVLLIHKNSMSVRESTSFDVLTQETDVETFVKEGSKGERFGSCEVHNTFCFDISSSLIINLLDGGVDVEVLGI